MFSQIIWVPFLSLLHREIARFLKVLVQTVVTPIINSSLYLVIFGVSLGKSIQLSSGLPYLAFLIPGLVMMGCLNNAFQNSASSITSAKFGGDLEDFRVSPLSDSQIVWAVGLGGLIRGAVVGLITFLVGQIFYWVVRGELLGVAEPLTLIFFILIGGLSFSILGLSVAIWAKSFDHMASIGSFILAPLLYLGGVFFSLENLSPFWQFISKFNPLLYLINGVRYGILGQSDVEVNMAYWTGLLTLLVFYLIARLSLKRGSFQRW